MPLAISNDVATVNQTGVRYGAAKVFGHRFAPSAICPMTARTMSLMWRVEIEAIILLDFNARRIGLDEGLWACEISIVVCL
jgi:hypothetical protein